ncbi:cytochrome P450 [Pseudonocardia sp. NPDC049635]|uniref:cytochrome P450 n=1 Tax=Pseudonocardia sp. NPDC049635 TaxID=3155506 RepID=UPI0033FADE1F
MTLTPTESGPPRSPVDPIAEISLAALNADPYPIYARLRAHEPVAWVPALGYHLVTRYEDIVTIERNPGVFSSAEDPSVVVRAIGKVLMRRDGESHRALRAAAEASFRPRAVRSWADRFRALADDLLDDLGGPGPGEADLFADYFRPLAARALAAVLGLRGVSDTELFNWSQDMIDGCANHAQDPAVWARNDAAVTALDAAVAASSEHFLANPDDSIVSAMLHVDPPLDVDDVQLNVRVIIAGGINELRDSGATATYALLTHPEQRAAVEADPTLWKRVFEEAVRWIAPIGMYPRQVVEDTQLAGVPLHRGARVGVVVASANRDERRFTAPDEFDIHAHTAGHLAFGSGPHFCLGAWMARICIGQIALPALFDRFEGLELANDIETRWAGWVFRGPLNLPVRWRRDRSCPQ